MTNAPSNHHIQVQPIGSSMTMVGVCRYDSEDTPMREYANVHDFLQKRRSAALTAGSEGPRTMVRSQLISKQVISVSNGLNGAHSFHELSVPAFCFLCLQMKALMKRWCQQVLGQTDAGKSTLCKILLNYAIRQDCAPTMVDLDPGEC